MCPNCDRDVEIIVPTGALGNVTCKCKLIQHTVL
jgi:hypothetical protein